MTIPTDCKFTKNDEWIRVEGGAGTAGITDYAQEALSDIVYVEFPAVGDSFQQGQAWGTVESVKAASDVYMPASGTISAVNENLKNTPEVVNSDPFGAGWMVKFTLTAPAELDGLMDAAAYEQYCAERKA